MNIANRFCICYNKYSSKKANSGTKSKGKSPVGCATGDFFILIFKSLLTGLLRLPFTIQPCGNDVKNHTCHNSKQR